MRPQETLSIETSEEANLQALATYKPSKTVTISSSETLEITISRSGMEVNDIVPVPDNKIRL